MAGVPAVGDCFLRGYKESGIVAAAL